MNKKGEETFQVLFVGIMDVTSAYLADRLSREGSRIFWLTPQQKPYAYQRFKARIYRHALTREAIRSMLRLHDIDSAVQDLRRGHGERTSFKGQLAAFFRQKTFLRGLCEVVGMFAMLSYNRREHWI